MSSVTAVVALVFCVSDPPPPVAYPISPPLEVIAPVAAMLVAVAAPRTGVTRVGVFANTAAPVPVSSDSADRRFALEGVARNVATPEPSPLTPVEIGSPVQFVSVPDDGVPRTGVTKVGLVANTLSPEPVFVVSAVARFAEDGVARNEATPVPSPDTPVATGKPVQFVKVPLVGVPRTGVTSVGVLAKTRAPEPVSSEMTDLSSDEVVAANADSLLDVEASVPLVGNVTFVDPVNVNVAA